MQVIRATIEVGDLGDPDYHTIHGEWLPGQPGQFSANAPANSAMLIDIDLAVSVVMPDPKHWRTFGAHWPHGTKAKFDYQESNEVGPPPPGSGITATGSSVGLKGQAQMAAPEENQ